MQLPDSLIDRIRETHRIREDFLRARNAQGLRVGAVCRRFAWQQVADVEPDTKAEARALRAKVNSDAMALKQAVLDGKTHPLADELLLHYELLVRAYQVLEEGQKEHAHELERLVKDSEAMEFVKATPGLGPQALGSILGECGNPAHYPSVRALYKRLGVGVIDGERQHNSTDPEENKRQGYSGARRSILHRLDQPLMARPGPYKGVYDARKQHEVEKAQDEGLTVVPGSRYKTLPSAEKATCIAAGHIDKRAKRYMQKRLVRNLWLVCRKGSWDFEEAV